MLKPQFLFIDFHFQFCVADHDPEANKIRQNQGSGILCVLSSKNATQRNAEEVAEAAVAGVISMEQRILPVPQKPNIMDQEMGNGRVKKKTGRKHKAKWLNKPMALAELILEIYDEDLRENALRCLSTHLNEKRIQEPEKYKIAAFYIYHGYGVMPILLQEVIMAYQKLLSGNFNIRASKRLSNVLTLFQVIAANKETRGMLVKANIPYYLLPFILSESREEFYEDIRAISLSVVGIIVQWRETDIIKWALDTGIFYACLLAAEIGSQVSKVIVMHIVESVLQDSFGISCVCEKMSFTLDKILIMCNENIMDLRGDQASSPCFLFHILRCYILLCRHPRALDRIRGDLPSSFLDNTLNGILEEFPNIKQLLHQLLLNIGKFQDSMFFGEENLVMIGLWQS